METGAVVCTPPGNCDERTHPRDVLKSVCFNGFSWSMLEYSPNGTIFSLTFLGGARSCMYVFILCIHHIIPNSTYVQGLQIRTDGNE